LKRDYVGNGQLTKLDFFVGESLNPTISFYLTEFAFKLSQLWEFKTAFIVPAVNEAY